MDKIWEGWGKKLEGLKNKIKRMVDHKTEFLPKGDQKQAIYKL